MQPKSVKNIYEYRNEIVMRLIKGPCFIIYKTDNRKEHKVLCTLHNQLLPRKNPFIYNSKKLTRAETPIVVYDIRNKVFRSFKVSNVLFFEELNKTNKEL